MKVFIVAVLAMCLVLGECSRFSLRGHGGGHLPSGGKSGQQAGGRSGQQQGGQSGQQQGGQSGQQQGGQSGQQQGGPSSQEEALQCEEEVPAYVEAEACPTLEQIKDYLGRFVQKLQNYETKTEEIGDSAAAFYEGTADMTFEDVANQYRELMGHVECTFNSVGFLYKIMYCIVLGGTEYEVPCNNMIEFSKNTEFSEDTRDTYMETMATEFKKDIDCFDTEYTMVEALAGHETIGSGRDALRVLMDFFREFHLISHNGHLFNQAVQSAYSRTVNGAEPEVNRKDLLAVRELLELLKKKGLKN